jgi:hypothetical protein
MLPDNPYSTLPWWAEAEAVPVVCESGLVNVNMSSTLNVLNTEIGTRLKRLLRRQRDKMEINEKMWIITPSR